MTRMKMLPISALDAYSWLHQLEPGLLVDVGASNGYTTLAMLKESPQSRAIAFEPFPGNHPFIERTLSSEPRTRVIRKAVANHDRPTKFYVASTIKNGTGMWAGMDGFSAVGMLIADSDQRAAHAITVETCRLDDEIAEPVRFLKIDVQGGEFQVLEGARRLFERYGVDLVLVEFTGDARILEFLVERSYSVFHTLYHSTSPVAELDPADWRIVSAVQLSTGRKAVEAVPLRAPDDPIASAGGSPVKSNATAPCGPISSPSRPARL